MAVACESMELFVNLWSDLMIFRGVKYVVPTNGRCDAALDSDFTVSYRKTVL